MVQQLSEAAKKLHEQCTNTHCFVAEGVDEMSRSYRNTDCIHHARVAIEEATKYQDQCPRLSFNYRRPYAF